MSLQNFSYFFFLFCTVCIYLRLPQKAQTPFLLLASIAFYAKNLLTTYQSVLANAGAASAAFHCAVSIGFVAFMAVFVWCSARRLSALTQIIGTTQSNTNTAALAAKRTALLRGCVAVLLVLLCLFKYYNLSPLPTLLDGSILASLPMPLGVSFFTLAAIGYLIDVSRGKYQAEQSFIHTCVFLFFFATVTSGPICRGNQILPQLHQHHRFDETRTVTALRLFAIGLFKKIAIADVLGMLTNQVFGNFQSYGGLMLVFILPCYLLQLYFDFSGYSELARASGMFLGIDIPENFKTPYFSTSVSEIWTRWHISLSSWFRDYVYISLGGNRLGRRRAICNVMLTFLLSGLWHGNTLPFAFWAMTQVFFRTIEEFWHHKFGLPNRAATPSWLNWCKRTGVFTSWAFGIVFFRIGSDATHHTLADCWAYFAAMGSGYAPQQFISELNSAVASGFYQHQMLQILYLLFTVFTLTLGIYLDSQRFFIYHDAPTEQVLTAQKPIVKWVLYELLILCIFAGLILQNGGFAGGSFAYAQY